MARPYHGEVKTSIRFSGAETDTFSRTNRCTISNSCGNKTCAGAWHVSCFAYSFVSAAAILNSENRAELLVELPIGVQLVLRSPQTAPHDLLAEELRHERPQPDDVRHGIAVPSLGQHSDADNAADIATGRMQRAFELLRELL